MMSLKQEHNKLKKIANNLKAIIVVQEEEGHYENREYTARQWGATGSGGYDAWGETYDEWVVDKPLQTETDKPKLEAAKAAIKKIIEDSEFISVRVVAMNFLGMKITLIDNAVCSWINDIKTSCLGQSPSLNYHQRIITLDDLGSLYAYCKWRESLSSLNAFCMIMDIICECSRTDPNLLIRIHARQRIKQPCPKALRGILV